ncbi:nucleotidyltransferase domain-containing protein [Rhizobium sp. LjRoot258]|uniref:nucleotidyltransferase domain-containing protein n=1 Tax=Rhizobium sp. LjRoot258 TaxID=3342299 RepID=UPI003ECE0E3D
MTDSYLQQILASEAVDVSINSPARMVQGALMPVLMHWAGAQLAGVHPSGSFAKGTANRNGTDIDLFVSLHSDTTNTLADIYETLFRAVGGLSPKRQNVSINIKVNGYDVDLVPAKRQDNFSHDHSLYRRRANAWTKTNVQKHIELVGRSGRTSEIRLLKLWRNQKGLDFPSFYLELSTILALNGRHGSLSENVWHVLAYLRDSFPNARVVDPANTNNIISDDLTAQERARIVAAAVAARGATNWSQIVR